MGRVHLINLAHPGRTPSLRMRSPRIPHRPIRILPLRFHEVTGNHYRFSFEFQ
jgi:hypothetical protein